MKIYKDQINVQHVFKSVPKRIVSLVPSQTELLVDLGLEDSIVGITKFCVHPVHLKKSKTIIGGTKNIKFDKIKALQPDIIIANKEENTKEIVTVLSEICPVWVTDIATLGDNNKMILDFGMLFDKESNANNLILKINSEADFLKLSLNNKPIWNVAYFIWANPYMVAGSNTFINQMLKLNNFENAYESIPRYPAIEIQEIGNEVDLILLSSEPFSFKEIHALEITKYTNAKIMFVDGEMFSWHGSRILKAFTYFKELRDRIEEYS